MCVYSMIADGWMNPPWGPSPPHTPWNPPWQWPPKEHPIPLPGLPKDPINDLLPLPKLPREPNVITLPKTEDKMEDKPNALPDIFKPSFLPLSKITSELAAKMLLILELLDEVDKATGAKDCLLNAAEKKQFVENLRKIAGKKCPCKKKKAKKKAKLLTETTQINEISR